MPIMYYGSRISENMTKTPEGYLICRNVPIGRIGYMEYFGEEIGLEDRRGEKIKVFRKPEELFSKKTIASFEGKPATNEHPSNMVDVDTISSFGRGHTENVRQEGDFLMADLYITDAGLISEIENGKREVSCGYDCMWIEHDDGTWEQKEIVGNHVAVVQAGRAGPRVAIKDSKYDGGSTKMSKKVNKSFLAALGLKAFAKDADPEEIAKAMDELNNEPDGDEGAAGAKDEGGDNIAAAVAQLTQTVQVLVEKVAALEKSDEQVHKEVGADEEFTGLENELSKEPAADAGEEGKEEEVADEVSDVIDSDSEEEEGEKKEATDSASYIALVKQMKPIIMAIPDEKARNEAAKAFSKSVRDAMGKSSGNNAGAYGKIMVGAKTSRKAAADSQKQQSNAMEVNAQTSVSNWNKMNAHYKGENK